MRPLPYGSGKYSSPETYEKFIRASMRPLPYGSGKGFHCAKPFSRIVASMRPLPYGSGKRKRTRRNSSKPKRFNEAAPLRKRKETFFSSSGVFGFGLQ